MREKLYDTQCQKASPSAGFLFLVQIVSVCGLFTLKVVSAVRKRSSNNHKKRVTLKDTTVIRNGAMFSVDVNFILNYALRFEMQLNIHQRSKQPKQSNRWNSDLKFYVGRFLQRRSHFTLNLLSCTHNGTLINFLCSMMNDMNRIKRKTLWA